MSDFYFFFSPELSKSYMDMASKLFTFTFTFTCEGDDARGMQHQLFSNESEK